MTYSLKGIYGVEIKIYWIMNAAHALQIIVIIISPPSCNPLIYYPSISWGLFLSWPLRNLQATLSFAGVYSLNSPSSLLELVSVVLRSRVFWPSVKSGGLFIRAMCRFCSMRELKFTFHVSSRWRDHSFHRHPSRNENEVKSRLPV